MSFKTNVPETFQNCLSAILETRGISATQLAAMLGYKSKTTLLRILQGDAGLRCVGNVYKDLCCCEALRLTEQETDRLHIAYEVELWGLDNYRARMEMWHLLRRNDTPALPMELMTCGKTITLQELLDTIVPEGVPGEMPVSSLEIMMLSGCYPNVMEQLAGLLERMGNRIRATQLFMLNNDTARTVRMIRNIMPVLGFHSYEAYYVYPSIIVPEPLYSGSGTGKVMILRAVLPDGKAREFQVLMHQVKADNITVYGVNRNMGIAAVEGDFVLITGPVKGVAAVIFRRNIGAFAVCREKLGSKHSHCCVCNFSCLLGGNFFLFGIFTAFVEACNSSCYRIHLSIRIAFLAVKGDVPVILLCIVIILAQVKIFRLVVLTEKGKHL